MNFVKGALRLAPLILSANGLASQGPTWIDNSRDVQLYLKTKYDFFHTYDQEFGIQATLFRYGNLAEVTNFAYDPIYPLRFDREPRFTVGFQFVYFLTPLPLKLGVYTKPKYNFINTWKEETGVTVRLFTSKTVTVSANLAYIQTYPFLADRHPGYLGLVNFAFPLGR